MFLIDDILFAPITGFQFVMRTLAKVAEEQYTDDAPLKERLLELQVRLESGEVNEEEYAAEEAEILRLLREIQHRKMEMAGVPADQMERGPMSASEATFTIDTNPPGTQR
jgi:cytochrome c-type biogenesis protein CcmH/NrfG